MTNHNENDDKLMQLLIDAQRASADAGEARQQALPAVVEACRTLERALQEALGGEPLRGLKNIGTLGEKLYAARIRACADNKLPSPNDKGGYQQYLCVSAKGELVMAFWAEDDGVIWLTTEPALDEGLRIDDIDAFVRTLREVLPRHIKAARSTGGRYMSMQRLAHRIRDVTKGEAA